MLRWFAVIAAIAAVLWYAITLTAADTRPTDMSAMPPEEVNPRPSTVNPPPPARYSEAQAYDTLRHFGYLNITGLTQLPDGRWTARAQQQFDGPMRQVTLDLQGNVSVK
jgi:hypothetical protein